MTANTHTVYFICGTEKIGVTRDFERRKKEHRMSKKYGDDPRFMVLSELEGVTDEEAATEEKWWQNTAICGAMRATAITRRADDETRVQPII
jgi:predicted GIY-YIG superfamily endonuclease